jgi:phospholipid/cholesterol/gamma-HCH transport system substrate-binding protein
VVGSFLAGDPVFEFARESMESKRENVLVGLFTLVAAALLVVVVLLLSGTFGKGTTSYRAYFKNAGGLAPGSEVRYAGGPPIGRVEKVTSDPANSTRMEIEFAVDPSVPVKTDSLAEITSNSPLGDNFLGIRPGSLTAPRAQNGAVLNSVEYTSLADVAGMIAQLEPNANNLITSLNERVDTLKITLDRVNDLLNDENRKNISGTVAELHGILSENRANLKNTLSNVNAVSARLNPLIDNFNKTAAQANDTLSHIDAVIGEDRPDLHKAIASLRLSLDQAVNITGQLNSTLNANSENLDEILDNLKHITDNMNEFTETIKTRPYTLIRASGLPPRVPGQAPPK